MWLQVDKAYFVQSMWWITWLTHYMFKKNLKWQWNLNRFLQVFGLGQPNTKDPPHIVLFFHSSLFSKALNEQLSIITLFTFKPDVLWWAMTSLEEKSNDQISYFKIVFILPATRKNNNLGSLKLVLKRGFMQVRGQHFVAVVKIDKQFIAS